MKDLSLQQIFARAEEIQYEKNIHYTETTAISGKTYLGSSLEGLKKISLKIYLHCSFCNPQEVIDEIENYSKNKKVFDYFQNEKYMGEFLITKYDVSLTQVFNETLICAIINVQLTEAVMPEIPKTSLLPYKSYPADSDIIKNIKKKAEKAHKESIIDAARNVAIPDNISNIAKKVLNTFKDSAILCLEKNGLVSVYYEVEKHIENLEQDKILTEIEKEIIKTVLRKIPEAAFDEAIGQTPKETITRETFALTDSKASQKWIMPCKGRNKNNYGEQRPTHTHNGIDIIVPVGTPIRAVADGTILAVGPASGYGYWVVINHGIINGKIVTSEYGHLSKWKNGLIKGVKVKQGDIIAYSGNTGYSSTPHLHLTIREGSFQGTPVNPYKYINPQLFYEDKR